MLVLTRKCGEQAERDGAHEIRIGDDIIVRVLDVNGSRVRLGIVAPPEVDILRSDAKSWEPKDPNRRKGK